MMTLNNHDTFLRQVPLLKCIVTQYNSTSAARHYSEEGEGCCKNLKGEGKKK